MIINLFLMYLGMNRPSPWGRSQGQGNTSSNTWKGEGTPGSQGSSNVGELIDRFSVSFKFA